MALGVEDEEAASTPTVDEDDVIVVEAAISKVVCLMHESTTTTAFIHMSVFWTDWIFHKALFNVQRESHSIDFQEFSAYG